MCLDERDVETACRSIEGDPDTSDSAANDENVDGPTGPQLIKISLPSTSGEEAEWIGGTDRLRGQRDSSGVK